MKKLTLKVDELAVESFAVVREDEAARGTVDGQAFLATQPRELCKTILTYCPCTPRADEF